MIGSVTRQAHGEERSKLFGGFHIDGASMSSHDFPGNMQAQANAAGPPSLLLLGLRATHQRIE